MKSMEKEQLLGTIEDVIVGAQYADATVAPGEAVYFEREPENNHDPSAIRAQNPDLHPVGYLPRRLVRWLAPLLDGGKVTVDGRALPGEARRHGELPVALDVFLCKKGQQDLSDTKHMPNWMPRLWVALVYRF